MRVDFDERFVEQRERYGFLHTCEHCAHFDEVTGECLHGFPNEEHRMAFYDPADPPSYILFCKDFDLA